jgi:hypothetical protein
MALIKINDLNPIVGMSTGGNRVVNGDWIELDPSESGSVFGGWRHRSIRRSQAAVNVNIDRINNLFQVAIADFMNNDLTTASNSSTPINPIGNNFFYTDSGIAPIGGVPIPEYPGAYTF